MFKDVLNNNEFLKNKIKDNKDIRNQIIFIILEYIAMSKDIDEEQMNNLLKEIGGEGCPYW